MLNVLIALQLLCLFSGRAPISHAGLPSSSTPSLYVFGASMVDTGENWVAMPGKQNADFEPYGSDYFGKPAGRWSNGRILMDFIMLSYGFGEDHYETTRSDGDKDEHDFVVVETTCVRAQELGIGLLSPYLKSFGSNFTYGVNFASSGSTARNTTATGDESGGLFALLVQIDQFRVFQNFVLSQQEGVLHKLRMRQHFSNSLYFIETAHNDYLSVAFKTEDFDAVSFIEAVITAIRDALQALYDSGARTFVVMNVTPLGCNPSTATNPYRTENRDEYGCKVDYLELVNRHNEHLIKLLSEFRVKYPAAEWIVYDAYSIMLDAYHNPSNYGVKYPFQACCGYGGGKYNYNSDVQCGKPGIYINGTFAVATKCEDPSLHIIWDTLHPVESFCRYLAQGVLDGTHLLPTINITERFNSATQTKKLFIAAHI